MSNSVNLILASAYPSGAIGEAGQIPWHLAEDLQYFKRMTTRGPCTVIMGRKTWDSLGHNPLPRRLNIVISTTCAKSSHAHVVFVKTFDDALRAVPSDHTPWVIGGAGIYAAAVASSADVRIYQTEIYSDFKGADVFWKIPDGFQPVAAGEFQSAIDSKTGQQLRFRRLEWVRADAPSSRCGAVASSSQMVLSSGINPEEDQYLDLLRRVMDTTTMADNRTGVRTKALFGAHMRFDLRTGFPAITTKALFWRGVVEELLWILSGDTNARHLSDIGVHIWDKDTSREYLDKRGRQHLQEFEAGATYGHNMRHFGAKYRGAGADYTGLGVDQLAAAVKTLRENPGDRRIIINLWDPNGLEDAALPPCLLMYIFYVSDGRLSCMTIQRSADLMLGVPFNIASSSLFAHILANMAGLEVGEVDHNMTNAHLYETHFAAAKEQLERRPYPKCLLEMPKEDDGSVKKLTLADIDVEPRVLSARDFRLVGYRHWPKLKNATEMCA